MNWLADDLRVALRRCLRQPGFTVVVVLTLALGLGANIAVFTLIDAVMLRSLPVERPQELYRLGDTTNCCVNSGLQRSWSLFSWALFQHLKQNAPEFSELAAMQAGAMQIGMRTQGSSVPHSLPAQFVTANYFRMFGVKPAAGRLFEPDDDRPGAAPVAVMSYRAWAREGLDPAVIGRPVVVNGLSLTIVGVAAAAFYGDTTRPDPTGLWLPMGQEPALRGDSSLINQDQQQWLNAIGRLSPGASPASIGARLTPVLQQWLSGQANFTALDRERIPLQTLVVTPAGGGVPVIQGQFSQSLTLMFLTSAVLLLIACANLANLLLARADRGQAAIRAALGASARRLMRQSVVEGLVLAIAGGLAGLVVANLGTRMLIALAFPGGVYVPVDASPSITVMLFAFALAVVTGVLFTAAPAWAMSRTAPLDALAGVGRSVHQKSFIPRRSLVIAQVSMSFAMITSAGLLAGSLNNLETQKLGFDPNNRLVIRIVLPDTVRTPEQFQSLFERLRERLQRVPGVVEAGYSLSGPMDGNNWQSRIRIAGRASDPEHPDQSSWNRVGPGYFSTVGTRILRGRTIEVTDAPGSHRVAVINEAFAKRFFENTDPIGRTVGVSSNEAHAGDFEIVGIVEDVKYTQVTEPVRPMLFLSAFQSVRFEDPTSQNVELRSMSLRSVIVRTRADAGNLEPALRAAAAEVNADLDIAGILPLSMQVSGNFRIQRLLSRLTSLYAGLALILTALGLYGVTSYSVSRRTREIGVRMALGADRSTVMRNVISGPVLETAMGLAIGLPLAMLAGSAIGSQLYGLGAQNPTVWGITIAILIVTSILAAAIPARRASTIDPARALRGE